VVVVFKATVKRDPASSVPRIQHRDIDRLLGSISTGLQVVVEYEIRSETGIRKGLGVVLKRESRGVVVVDIHPGSDADKSGIEAADRLVRVNGVPVSPDATSDQVEAMIANAPARGVELTLARSQRRFRLSIDKMEYNLERFSWRTTHRVIPSTAFGQIVRQSKWSPIEPPA